MPLFSFFSSSQALDRIDELGIEGRHADACGAARAKAEELQKADKLNRDLDAAAKRRDAVALAALLATLLPALLTALLPALELATVLGATEGPPLLLEACETEFARAFGTEAIFGLVALARRRPDLEAMSQAASLRAGDQMRWIATFLFTGEVDGEVTYYDYCLGWQALTFATAPGLCGGPFGHWQEPER